MTEVKQVMVYFYPEQHEVLRKMAFEQHKTVSEIVREAVKLFLSHEQK